MIGASIGDAHEERTIVYSGRQKRPLAETAHLFSRAALLTGPHGGAFLNLIYCAASTHIVEIGYRNAKPMAYPSYYHTMARRLGQPFWVVLGEGGYDQPITAPVKEVASLAAALLGGAWQAGMQEHRGSK